MGAPSVLLALLLSAHPAAAEEPAVRFKFARPVMPFDAAIVSNAKVLGRLAKSNALKFSDNEMFPDDYWEPYGDGNWALKDKAKAAEAVRDVLKRPGKYSIECNAATKFLLYLAILDHIGERRFNEAVAQEAGRLYIGNARGYQGPLGRVMERAYGRAPTDRNFPGMASSKCLRYIDGKEVPCDTAADERLDAEYIKELQPGDAGAIINIHATNPAYFQENVIYVGGGEFFAFPFGIKPESALKADVADSWDRKKTAPAGFTGGFSVPNGPPGFVRDYSRPSLAKLGRLGLAP